MSRLSLRTRFRRGVFRPARNFVVGRAAPLLIRSWAATARVRWSGEFFRTGNDLALPTPAIYAFWHQRLIGLSATCADENARVLISDHGDGEMIAQTIRRLGLRPLRGSTTRGGSRAVLEVLRAEEQAFALAITPDGPRGPKHELKKGAIYVASRGGVPIYPMTIAFSRCLRLRTWDEMLLPTPFCRAVAVIGEPIHVPAELEREGIEEYRLRTEQALRRITRDIDRNFEALYAAGRRIRDLMPRPERLSADGRGSTRARR